MDSDSHYAQLPKILDSSSEKSVCRFWHGCRIRTQLNGGSRQTSSCRTSPFTPHCPRSSLYSRPGWWCHYRTGTPLPNLIYLRIRFVLSGQLNWSSIFIRVSSLSYIRSNSARITSTLVLEKLLTDKSLMAEWAEEVVRLCRIYYLVHLIVDLLMSCVQAPWN
jgi:hypothetical protein